ncbi:MAG: acyl-CoA dehydrogenase family protein, partial [Gammaproteobacteria bacterium]|nr:acyl-CoA dehydrogenase family protein [Gammaproteobacteria bacterium]
MSTNRDEFSEIARQIAELKPIIEAHADEAEEQRHLGNEVARSMALAGLYRIAVPRSLGGGEAHPITQIKTIEAVSEIHGSTGWNLMIGIETMGILGGSLTRSVTKQLYADPELVIAGTLNPLGQAVPCDGGYRITGQWPFASGIHNAQYFWSQSIVQKDGERLKDERGFVFCESMVPVSQVEILDTWHVSGLRGSGSHDVRLEDVF